MGADIQQLKKKITSVAEKYGLAAVYLFGSRARGDFNQKSDYDFYVDAPMLEDMFELAALFTDMKDTLKAEVDIVLKPDKYTKLDDYIAQAVERDGVLVYG